MLYGIRFKARPEDGIYEQQTIYVTYKEYIDEYKGNPNIIKVWKER